MCRGRCYEDIRQYNAVEEGYAWLWGGWMIVLDKVAEKTSMKGWHWRKWEVQARGCLERATKAEGGEIGEALRQGCGVLGVFGKKKLASATGALANFFSPNRGEVMPERCWSLCLLGLVGLGEDCGLYWVRWEVMGKSGLCFQRISWLPLGSRFWGRDRSRETSEEAFVMVRVRDDSALG